MVQDLGFGVRERVEGLGSGFGCIGTIERDHVRIAMDPSISGGLPKLGIPLDPVKGNFNRYSWRFMGPTTTTYDWAYSPTSDLRSYAHIGYPKL